MTVPEKKKDDCFTLNKKDDRYEKLEKYLNSSSEDTAHAIAEGTISSIPGIGGFDILANLERNNSLKDQNIILFTASIIHNDVLEGLLEKDGIKCCLRKPGTLAKVLEVLTA